MQLLHIIGMMGSVGLTGSVAALTLHFSFGIAAMMGYFTSQTQNLDPEPLNPVRTLALIA